MNRIQTIYGSLQRLGKTDEELFQSAIDSIDLDTFTCHGCGASGQCRFSSHYRRHLITLENFEDPEPIVLIPCVYCPNCDYFHAILPDIIIPYCSYSLRFVLTVLYSYAFRVCSVEALCTKWHIAVSTLYNWISLFNRDYDCWAQAIHRIRRTLLKSCCHILEANDLPRDFFLRFRFSFLQANQKTHSKPLPQKRRAIPPPLK